MVVGEGVTERDGAIGVRRRTQVDDVAKVLYPLGRDGIFSR
jgi:hypothetical protein